jgi:hypothetical protein
MHSAAASASEEPQVSTDGAVAVGMECTAVECMAAECVEATTAVIAVEATVVEATAATNNSRLQKSRRSEHPARNAWCFFFSSAPPWRR